MGGSVSTGPNWPKPSRRAVASCMFAPGNVIGLINPKGVEYRVVRVDAESELVFLDGLDGLPGIYINFDDITDDWVFILAKRVRMGDLMQ